MNLSRRSFLRGIIAVGTVAAVAPKLLSIPRIWGNLEYDDTEGLQALFDRQPVEIMHDAVKILPGGNIAIRGGKFLISDQITITQDHTMISDAIFSLKRGSYPSSILNFKDCDHCAITDSIICGETYNGSIFNIDESIIEYRVSKAGNELSVPRLTSTFDIRGIT